jgi:hypothetical protein
MRGDCATWDAGSQAENCRPSDLSNANCVQCKLCCTRHAHMSRWPPCPALEESRRQRRKWGDGETGARMNLEQEIIAIEESADAVVAAARTEAKRLIGSLDERRKAIRDEIAARVEEEKARMKRENAAGINEALAEIAREQAGGEAAIEKGGGTRVPACVRGIIEAL